MLECTHPDGRESDRHLTPAAAGRIAAAAACRRLLLVHLSAELEGFPVEASVRGAWKGPLTLASDGIEADI